MKKIFLLFLILICFYPFNSNSSEQRTYKIDGPNSKILGSLRNYEPCNNLIAHRKKKECRISNFSEVSRSTKYRRTVNRSYDKLEMPFYEKPPNNLLKKAENFMNKNPVMALLIIKDGKRVLEKYQYVRNRTHRFRSFSMSKSITAMLTGIAIDKGFIKSIEDPVGKYWPEIKNSVYGDISIKNLLRMSSLIFNEDLSLDKEKTATTELFFVLNKKSNFNKPELLEKYINNLKKINKKKQGSDLVNTSVDTEILVRVLVKATGKNLSTLTEEWIWQPMGGINAFWLYSTTDSIENGAGGFNATLNDYGRLGILLANDGKRDGNQIIPKEFLHNGTRKSKIEKQFLNKGDKFYYGYGYQTWILDLKQETFCLSGHYGQFLCVQPSTKIVYVQLSAGDHFLGKTKLYRDTYDFFKYTLDTLGK